VVVINHGRLFFDGPLNSIVERFSEHKIIKLRFHNGRMPERFDDYAEVLELAPPTVTLRVPRAAVAELTGRMLAAHQIDDVTVLERPIEEVISEVFTSAEPIDRPVGL
jgi:ABC-2 type transport system ATP-binding protein